MPQPETACACLLVYSHDLAITSTPHTVIALMQDQKSFVFNCTQKKIKEIIFPLTQLCNFCSAFSKLLYINTYFLTLINPFNTAALQNDDPQEVCHYDGLGGRFMTVINTSSPIFPLSTLLMLHLQTPWLT